MNILLASESFVVRESLENLFQELLYKPEITTISNLNQMDINEIIYLDFLFIEIKENWENEMKIIEEAKNKFKNLKIMILDPSNNKNIFERAVQLGVDGYIIGFNEKEEFIFNLKKILQGKKVYEAELIQSILYYNRNKTMDILTKRETEVLKELGKGLNNKEISSNLYITEYTVKKHVSHILDKLNLKNRQEAILYIAQNPF